MNLEQQRETGLALVHFAAAKEIQYSLHGDEWSDWQSMYKQPLVLIKEGHMLRPKPKQLYYTISDFPVTGIFVRRTLDDKSPIFAVMAYTQGANGEQLCIRDIWHSISQLSVDGWRWHAHINAPTANWKKFTKE